MRIVSCICALLLIALNEVQASGLSTSFVDVAVFDVPLGKPRRVEDREGRSLVLHNTGDVPLRVQITALQPEPRELKFPAQPLDDLSWVKFSPPMLEIPPQETATCDVILTLPDQRRLKNRLFQVMVLSKTVPQAGSGIALSAALKSRLRFKTVRR